MKAVFLAYFWRMKQSLFLLSELYFILLKFHNSTTNIDFEVCISQISSCCLLCQTISFKIHSRYARTIGDLPVSGKLPKLKLQVRKFFCENCIFLHIRLFVNFGENLILFKKLKPCDLFSYVEA